MFWGSFFYPGRLASKKNKKFECITKTTSSGRFSTPEHFRCNFLQTGCVEKNKKIECITKTHSSVGFRCADYVETTPIEFFRGPGVIFYKLAASKKKIKNSNVSRKQLPQAGFRHRGGRRKKLGVRKTFSLRFK